MSILSTPWVAAAATRLLQGGLTLASYGTALRRSPARFPEFPATPQEITIPTTVAQATRPG